jgi:hypothetical protein
MAKRTGQIVFEQKGLGGIVSESRLKVPINQRTYAWQDKHVNDLLRDFAGSIGTGEYFLGTIVLACAHELPEVTDGQQRLATATILLAAIRDYFSRNGHGDRAKTIQDEFLLKRDLRTGEIVPRLQLNIEDDEYFRKSILSEPDSKDRDISPTKPSHFLIKTAAQLATEQVNWIVAKLHGEDKLHRLIDWVEFIKSDAMVVVVKVPDEINAFTMFETLNDRGRKVAQADVLKNFLFDQAKDDVSRAHPKWLEMTGILDSVSGDEDIAVDYIRHYWITQNGHTREKELADKIKAAINTKQKAVDFVTALADGARDYAALLSTNHEKWNAYGNDTRRHIATLNLHLRVSQIRPLLLAISQRFSMEEAQRAFRLCVNWSVRFLISGGRGGLLDENYALAACEIGRGNIITAKGLYDALLSILPNDQTFAAEFANARVGKNFLARYYLRALELQIRDETRPEFLPNEDEECINLEHILPERPDDSWGVDHQTASAMFRLIGNMVLLKADVNARIGNVGFSEKKKHFANSAFVLTQRVSQKEQWTMKEIVARQQELALTAVQTWPLTV